MTENIFADTSAIIAVMNKKDRFHAQATATFEQLTQSPARLLLTTHVFAETVTRIARRLSSQKAVVAGNLIRQEPHFEIVTPHEETIDHAWEIFQKYQDQNLSFVDCISFALMQELKIKKAFAFDQHFHILGFEVL